MTRTIALFAALALAAPAALAHATFENREVAQNSTVRMVTRIPHGCGAEATLRVRVAIPEGVISVKPMPKAGWDLEIVRGPYERSYELWGATITEGVRELIWTGELPDEHYDEFVWRARFTDALPAGETLYIPVVQECATSAERWIEIPAAGQSGADLAYPAPGVKVTPAAGGGH
ncbi:YcnI family copper-binding membrane protein [Rubrimonas sp.]|uniref:YcnI family copper-binding membrane protein n=1 Tax=Rubrimonas sp. TaxID=2036015 RepID=UPI002FDD4EC5